jgi:hypothetical protein
MLTLHVTNGDSAAQGLARSGLPGDVVAWRDVLHDGPVPAGDPCDAFRAARGAFLASRHWASAADVAADFSARDARLAEPASTDEVVLWFEPDLYDQLQLIQILQRFAARAPGDRPPLSIVPADYMLGGLPPEKFRPAYAQRRAITDRDLTLAALAWRAFTAPHPESLLACLDGLSREIPPRTYADDDAVRLPHLAAAMRRMLEEYPDAETGLSRSERQICEAVHPGPITLGKLFPASHHASESWPWLGDLGFAWYVERLSDGGRPLVSHPNGTRVLAPRAGSDATSFWGRTVVLTPFGVEALHGRANHVDANGIDRWIGGVHLTSAQHWRWDARTQRLVSVTR